MKPDKVLEDVIDLLVTQDPRALAERVLDATVTDSKGERRAAIFSREQDLMTLFVSRGVNQAILHLVHRVWAERHKDFERAEIYSARDSDVDPILRPVLLSAVSLVIVPLKADNRVAGLLYVDSSRPFKSDQLTALVALGRIASVAVKPSGAPRMEAAALETYLARTSSGDIRAQQLLVLLERNEWKIARVARLLHKSRPTIYDWMRRFGIERKRVYVAS